MNVALDLDGTLISCEPRQSAVLRAALIHSGAAADVGLIWKRKRAGASTEQALLQEGLKADVARRVAADWRQMIEEPFWLGLDSILPGVREAMGRLRASGATLWLLTARSRPEWVALQLAQLGLSQWLDRLIVVSGHSASAAKATALLESSAVAFFGDTESDGLAAAAAGVPFYGVATGQRNSEYLAAMGITRILADLKEATEAFLATFDRGVRD